MTDQNDLVTRIIKISTDIFFISSPATTSMGILFGVVLYGVISLLRPALAPLSLIDLDSTNPLFFIAFGVFCFNLPKYIKGDRIDPTLEEALTTIRTQLRDGVITEKEAQLQRKKLVRKYLESVQLKPQIRTRREYIVEALLSMDKEK